MTEFTFETLEEEMRAVLARHNDLLSTKQGAARAAGKLIKMADKAARPHRLYVETRSHPDGVALVMYPDQEVLAFLGSYREGDWLDEMQVDVSRFTHIYIRADAERDGR